MINPRKKGKVEPNNRPLVSEVKRSIEGVNTPVEWYETEGLSTYRECEY